MSLKYCLLFVWVLFWDATVVDMTANNKKYIFILQAAYVNFFGWSSIVYQAEMKAEVHIFLWKILTILKNCNKKKLYWLEKENK